MASSSPGPSGDRYLLDNARPEAGTRFGALSELFDPSTFGHIDRLGIAPGWRCWEVGAGGSSVVSWLAGRVGPSGRVVATDIDTSWVSAADGDVVTVLRHDVARDAPPDGGGFDLVHARLVLVHVTDRDRALRTMAGALRPGGVLLIEDADPALQPLACLDEHGPDQELANRMRIAFRTLLASRGADLSYGRKLPRLLREAGLADVRADGYFPVSSPACGVLEASTIRHVRDALVDAGLATDADIDANLAAIDAGRLDLSIAPMISAWGRRT
ncbi:methyltransferase domain-containing protein [Actinomadura roseirufa]|uniref:methyltransferase domain-containing protein n=1 Tax=Actinomadura roseirufa TaxID=2094049 RepID=UPI001041AFD0|nr:methyltransferase domain-containing protein [Actinomadura roseirufa]